MPVGSRFCKPPMLFWVSMVWIAPRPLEGIILFWLLPELPEVEVIWLFPVLPEGNKSWLPPVLPEGNKSWLPPVLPDGDVTWLPPVLPEGKMFKLLEEDVVWLLP